MTTAATMFMIGPAAMVRLRCQMGFSLYTGSPGPSGASRSSWRVRSTASVARSAATSAADSDSPSASSRFWAVVTFFSAASSSATV